MVKVTVKSGVYETQDPRTKKWEKMVNVTYVEEGRKTGNKALTRSTELLDGYYGVETGLPQARTHTQPVRADVAKTIKIGDTLPFHVNRGLFSFPNMRMQMNARPQNVDNRPTFFGSWLDDEIKEDEDARLDNNKLADVWPQAFQLMTIINTQMKLPAAKQLAIDNPEGVATAADVTSKVTA